MEINIGLGYFVEQTKRNFILKQRYFGFKKDGTRTERIKPHGSYGTFRKACEEYLRINQVPPESKLSVDLMGYVKLVEESNERAVTSLCKAIEGKEKLL